MSKPVFNVRVYGILMNDNNEVLISDEQEYGMRFSKFPGGGLEFGEGLPDGLKREFMEECNTEVEIVKHFYTTDFFVKSIFSESQIISVYYTVKAVGELNFSCKTEVFDFDNDDKEAILQAFRWVNINDLKLDDLTFPIDQHVAKLLTA
ncbi:NUDIX domain-containing protein [Mucilaginibacter glaciei]|uniref:NUDIX domain-containing protein n=1 Tax=Mucilaginibacter glaciei TaxID=2772109 RepID=A0A926S074_9SPHI|nr:NUDIX domain-containing protein [Mucilaginibacter glaciei]MBD1391733.1 NUDIX domain-containing protein [Mucilaginibacter glaciei]